MEALKIMETKKNLSWHYDAEADVLYIADGSPKLAVSQEVGEGTILRFDPDTNEIIGLTILNISKRALDTTIHEK